MKSYLIPALLALGLAVFVTGCGTVKGEDGEERSFTLTTALEFPGALVKVDVKDAQAALALAEYAGNEDWAVCWRAAIEVGEEQAAAGNEQPNLVVVGPLSALQDVSNAYRSLKEPTELIDPRLRQPCAVVALDLLRFARRAASRGIRAIVPGGGLIGALRQ